MKKTLLVLCISILTVALFTTFIACNRTDEGGDREQVYALDFNTVYAMAEEAGYTGTLEELKEMFKGENAYQLACAAGYTGTAEEWLSSLKGASGNDGATPVIGDNDHWFVGGVDTGVTAKGQNGRDGTSILTIEKASSEGNVDTYVITMSDGATYTYTVENGVGTNGLSAYEIAVEHGYTGTEAQWLASLNGKNGKDAAYTISDVYAAFKENYLAENGTEYTGTFTDFLQQFLYTAYADTSTEAVVSEAILSCVSVYCNFQTTTYVGNPWTGYRETIEQTTSAGAGVIYRLDKEKGDAYIITNYHVVFDATANTKISNDVNVLLYGYEFITRTDEEGNLFYQYAIPATYIGGSMNLDIAVLYVHDSDILRNSDARAVDAGDSTDLAVGQDVIAIGNPEASGIAVTGGIISVDSENNTMLAADNKTYVTFRVIRIDAAINGGNSGGGLFDAYGRLIGVVHAKMNSSAAENIAYAIPVNVATYAADGIIERFEEADKTGQFAASKCLLGVLVSATESRAVFDSETKRVRIIETVSITNEIAQDAAAYGKLQQGDVLKRITIDGKTLDITRTFVLTDSMLLARVGDTVVVEYERDGVAGTAEIVVTGTTEIDKIG